MYVHSLHPLSNVAELARVQTHGNKHKKKPIHFKALLVSSILCFFSVVHIDVTRALLAFGFLFLNKVKVSHCKFWFVPRCLPSKLEPNHLLDETLQPSQILAYVV